jgi:hypothetical protein
VSDDEGRCITIDEQENIYVGGSYVYSITFDDITLPYFGNYDLFVTKIDSSANVIWAKNAGGAYWNEYTYGITIDNNKDIIFTGKYSDNSVFGNQTLYTSGYSGFIAKLSKFVGINELTESNIQFSIYPNPSTTDFTIDLTNKIKSDIRINIYSIDGKEVYFEKIENAEGHLLKQINVSGLSKGLYLIKIETENNSFYKKILKQ